MMGLSAHGEPVEIVLKGPPVLAGSLKYWCGVTGKTDAALNRKE
jgi:hypothetical protein